MKIKMLAAAGLLASLTACGGASSSSDSGCREAVVDRAGQGEYGNQGDAVFKDKVREAYEDCEY